MKRIKSLISRADRLNLRSVLITELHNLINSELREQQRLINADYRVSKPLYRKLLEGSPESTNSKPALIVSTLDSIFSIKLDCMLSISLRMAGYQPIVIQLSHYKWTKRYHRLLGNTRFIQFNKFLSTGQTIDHRSVLTSFIESQPDIRNLMEFSFDGIDAGRIALSNILHRRKFDKFDISAPNTLSELEIEILNIERNSKAAQKLIDRYRPEIVVMIEKGLSPAAEVFGVCVERNIPVIQFVGSQNMNDFVLRRIHKKNRHQHPFSLDAATWKKIKAMPWSEKIEQSLMRDMSYGYRAGTWFKRKHLLQDKEIKKKSDIGEQFGLDLTKKTAVIFSHVLWDATFFYGESLFDDYETWLLESVRVACRNSNIIWLIKLHPDLVWKLQYENHSGELRDVLAIHAEVGQLPEHVKIVLPDTDISTYSFFDLTDYCVTVRGTIGIEMACHGIPVLTAGTGRYSDMGFTLDSASAAEYLERLATIERLPAMTAEQIELARRFAFALFKLRPWQMRSFEVVNVSLNKVGEALSPNLEPRVGGFEELSTTPDIQALADWINSDQIDYLHSENGYY